MTTDNLTTKDAHGFTQRDYWNAFDAGGAARDAGMAIESNPHPKDHPLHNEWHRGYLDSP